MLPILTALALLFVGVNALHADEQGKNEWYRMNFGTVESVLFYPPQSTSPRSIILASTEGALGSVSIANGQVQWRHVLSPADHVVCLMGASQGQVTAVTKTGVFYTLTGDGDILASRLLFESPSSILGCAVNASSRVMTIIALKEQTSDFLEVVKVSPAWKLEKEFSVQFDSGVLGASWTESTAGKFLWVQLQNQQIEVVDAKASGTRVPVQAAKGAFVRSVTAEGSAILQFQNGTQVLFAPSGQPQSKAFAECKQAQCDRVVLDADTVLSVVHQMSVLRVLVHKNFKEEGALTIPHLHRNAPICLGTHASRRRLLVLRSPDKDLALVSITDGLLWTRPEGAAFPAQVLVADVQNPLQTADRFEFNQTVFLLSKHGSLYKTSTVPPPPDEPVVVTRLTDVSEEVDRAFNVTDALSKTNFTRMSIEHGALHVTCLYPLLGALVVEVNATTGVIFSSKRYRLPNYAFSVGKLLISTAMKARHHPAHAMEINHVIFGVDFFEASKGILRGVSVHPNKDVKHTWKIKLGGALETFAASHMDALSASLVENICIFPNATSKVNEVRHKYPSINVLIVAHFERLEIDPTSKVLVISALDVVTGSFLATSRHENADGPVHLVAVEHMVFFHFFSTEGGQYILGTWEMFEAEDNIITDAAGATLGQISGSLLFPQGERTVSSFTLAPPNVVVQLLLFPPGAVGAMGITTSLLGIARRQLIFATEVGHVYAVDVRQTLTGGQKFPENATVIPITALITTSMSILSHVNSVMHPSLVVSHASKLESTSHVVVAGLDMFYARVSSSQAWDKLNDDFPFSALLVTCGVLAAIAAVLRFLADRKSLSAEWA